MAIYRLQCSFQMDTAFPRDQLVFTPHFETGSPLVPDSVDGLCEDLATALDGWSVGTQQITVKGYDAQDPPPNLPLGSAIRNTGANPASTFPRELALCLSYYSGQNAPRRRGRLYVPMALIAAGSTAGVRPSAAHQQKVADLVPILTGLGGIDVDWVVYSRMDDDARPVTNWYVDDEWDIIRSRGMRPVARLAGTASE